MAVPGPVVISVSGVRSTVVSISRRVRSRVVFTVTGWPVRPLTTMSAHCTPAGASRSQGRVGAASVTRRCTARAGAPLRSAAPGWVETCPGLTGDPVDGAGERVCPAGPGPTRRGSLSGAGARRGIIQVTQALRTYGKHSGIDPVAVFGGAPIRTQQAQLKQGAQVVVGTVGRVLDLISRHSLVLHSCRYLVLDEADEMLDLGFLEDVEKILSITPNGRQTALFSATMPAEIRALAERHLYDPVTVKVKSATLTIDTVEQFFVETKPAGKNDMLARVLESERPDQAIVFVRTKIRCDQLYRTLRDRGMNVKALHGDMSQGSRDGVMISFKDARVQILVATDVAARGLDISTVTHIINFDVPTSPDVYVHRIGRTGRVGRSGRAITFVEPRQARELAAIEKHANTKISPWAEGAQVAPAKVEEPSPRRHRKPHDEAVAGQRRRRLPQADRLRRPRRGARRVGPDLAPSPRPGSTARRSATSACWSGSCCSRCPPTRPRAWPTRSTAPTCAATRCASSSRKAEPHVPDDHDHQQGRHRLRDVRRRRPQDGRQHARRWRRRASTTASRSTASSTTS